jgi:hypothetical protein
MAVLTTWTPSLKSYRTDDPGAPSLSTLHPCKSYRTTERFYLFTYLGGSPNVVWLFKDTTVTEAASHATTGKPGDVFTAAFDRHEHLQLVLAKNGSLTPRGGHGSCR